MNAVCDRFDVDVLERLEQGMPLDAHFRSCSQCRAEVEGYGRLKAKFAAVAPVGGPPLGWEARVWSQIDRQETRRRIRLHVPVWASAAAALALGLFFVLPGATPEPSLSVEVVARQAEAVRSLSAKPGDVLRVQGTTGDRSHAQVRVYRDGVLLMSCSDQPPCARQGDLVSAEIPLASVGRYESVLLLADQPVEGEDDLDAAIARGAQVVTTGSVDVF